MRLWHIDLLKVLPKQQFNGQWRELCSIFKKQDNHGLINFVYDYDKTELFYYTIIYLRERKNRGYKFDVLKMTDYFEMSEKMINAFIENKNEIKKDIFVHKMNDRYLLQCYYNLEEKYDCKLISKEEWNKILTADCIKRLKEIEKVQFSC